MFSKAYILVRMAVANIFSSLLNLFVGLVLLFGAAILVIGGSVFSTLDDAMSKSIIGSITGHLQVYGAGSKDPLEIYGRVDGSDSNLSPIDDFKSLKAQLLTIPNVKQVVPMGAATAIVSTGNTVDVTLEKLRTLYRNQADAKTALPPDEFERQSHSLEAHAINMVKVIATDLDRAKELAADAVDVRSSEAVAIAGAEKFWQTFDDDPLGHLEFLENRVAPLAADADLLFIRYLGTDLEAYQKSFDRLTVVEGTQVPPGRQGILLPRFFSEEYLKLKNARRLDKIKDARAAGRRLNDASDKELQRFVKENQSQTREIVLQLDGIATATAVKKLQTFLSTADSNLPTLLSTFFSVTDETFDARYRFFYDELAPMLSMYRVRVGDTMTLRSFGRSGSIQTAVVKVYGIVELRGLEKSPLAGANALLDIITFRELYGFLTAEKRAEQEQMKAAAAAKSISRDSAEAELFGGGDSLVEEVKPEAITADVETDRPDEKRQPKAFNDDVYAVSEIDEGVVLNAAILLHDGSYGAQQKTREEIERLFTSQMPAPNVKRIAAARALTASGAVPAGLARAIDDVVVIEEARASSNASLSSTALLTLQQALRTERPALSPEMISTIEAFLESAKPKVWVVDWSSAAGFLGKFIDFFRMVLGLIVVAFGFIALVVVTIGMTIATLQRTSTIGTMRAIGAQRGFVLAMILIETTMLALSFGSAGAGLGAGVVKYLHATGIPAFRDELYFFFSGPVLRPELTAGGLGLAIVVMVVVSTLAVLFPVFLATRVAPITAMHSEE